MRKNIISILFNCFLLATPLQAQNIPLGKIIWDDFNYSGWNDKAAADFGWRFRTGLGWPSQFGVWSEKQVTFLNDSADATNRIMRFTNCTNGVKGDSTIQCQASKQPPVCRFGTYASRVRLRSKASSGPNVLSDKLTQTFYMIVGVEGTYTEPFLPDSLKKFNSPIEPHSEMDFEYLPHGGWNWPDFPPTMTNTSWAPDMLSNGNPGDYAGWHVLILVMDSLMATYYLDGKVLFTHTSHIPSLVMSLNYNQWFIELGTPGPMRTYVEDMDWVLYVDKKYLSLSDVNSLVNDFRSKGIQRLDKDLKGRPIKKN
jgi:hypothetical protein